MSANERNKRSLLQEAKKKMKDIDEKQLSNPIETEKNFKKKKGNSNDPRNNEVAEIASNISGEQKTPGEEAEKPKDGLQMENAFVANDKLNGVANKCAGVVESLKNIAARVVKQHLLTENISDGVAKDNNNYVIETKSFHGSFDKQQLEIVEKALNEIAVDNLIEKKGVMAENINYTIVDEKNTSEYTAQERNGEASEAVAKQNDEMAFNSVKTDEAAKTSANEIVTKSAKISATIPNWHLAKEFVYKPKQLEAKNLTRNQKIFKAQELVEQKKWEHAATQTGGLYCARTVPYDIRAPYNSYYGDEPYGSVYCRPIVSPTQYPYYPIPRPLPMKSPFMPSTHNAYRASYLQDPILMYPEFKKKLNKDKVLRPLEHTDLELGERIEREKALQEKKKAILRKNALEAMQMAESRRQRTIVSNLSANAKSISAEIGARLNWLYNDDPVDVEEQYQQFGAATDNVNARRHINRNPLRFSAEEEEKVCRDRAAKQARIEAYLREMKHEQMEEKIQNPKLSSPQAVKEKTDDKDIEQKKEPIRKMPELQPEDELRAEKESPIKYVSNTKRKEENRYTEYARTVIYAGRKNALRMEEYQMQQNNDNYYKKKFDWERKNPKQYGTQPIKEMREQAEDKPTTSGTQKSESSECIEIVGEANNKENVLMHCFKAIEVGEETGATNDAANDINDAVKRFFAQYLNPKAYGIMSFSHIVEPKNISSTILRYSVTDLKKLNNLQHL